MLNSIKKYKFLMSELVKRDFKKKYRGTMLGALWSMLSPLLQMSVMAMVFGVFFGRGIEHYIAYVFCGNLIFTFFNDSTRLGMHSQLSNAPIFTSVNVPSYLFTISGNVQTLINFGLTSVVFFIFAAMDGIYPTWRCLLLIYPVLCLLVFNTGVSLILSVLLVFFRDTQYLYDVFIRLLTYASAIFYSIDAYSESVRKIFMLNPVYVFITYFRQIVINGVIPSMTMHLLAFLYSVIALIFGLILYKKTSWRIPYYI